MSLPADSSDGSRGNSGGETRWVDCGPLSDLSFDPGAPVKIDDHWIAIFPLPADESPDPSGTSSAGTADGQTYYAIDNACPHASAPLCDGTLMRGKIVCHLHLWEFDVRTGACDVGNGEWAVRTYPTRITDQRLWVELPGKNA
ncbi:MAG: Rieske (2Fe-2S) protein [Planctomycetota bacterium]